MEQLPEHAEDCQEVQPALQHPAGRGTGGGGIMFGINKSKFDGNFFILGIFKKVPSWSDFFCRLMPN